MPGYSVDLTPMSIDQYDEVLALWKRCPGVGLSGADAREPIAGYLQRNPGMSFVAIAHGRIVGAILGGHDGRRGYIHHLAVDAPFRRLGIGRQLVDNCLSKLEEAGIQKCHLFIFHENREGIAFWEANAWTLRRDILVMSRNLEAKGE
jgi:ribosomal protein S18 acetylase RimI-like enzyme